MEDGDRAGRQRRALRRDGRRDSDRRHGGSRRLRADLGARSDRRDPSKAAARFCPTRSSTRKTSSTPVSSSATPCSESNVPYEEMRHRAVFTPCLRRRHRSCSTGHARAGDPVAGRFPDGLTLHRQEANVIWTTTSSNQRSYAIHRAGRGRQVVRTAACIVLKTRTVYSSNIPPRTCRGRTPDPLTCTLRCDFLGSDTKGISMHPHRSGWVCASAEAPTPATLPGQSQPQRATKASETA